MSCDITAAGRPAPASFIAGKISPDNWRALEAGWVRDERSALEWIGGIAQASLATLDLPVLYRLHAAWVLDDHVSVLRWNAFLIACRETAELRLEDRHLGALLLRVLAELELSTELFP